MLANWKRRNNNSPNRLIPKSDIALVHFDTAYILIWTRIEKPRTIIYGLLKNKKLGYCCVDFVPLCVSNRKKKKVTWLASL